MCNKSPIQFVFWALLLSACLSVIVADMAMGDEVSQRLQTPAGANYQGYVALVVGASSEGVNGMHSAGAASVLYGASGGLASADNQIWHQDVTGVTDAAEAPDRLGMSLATGDFDGNGFVDAAIGAPGEIVNGADNEGAVTVIYGSIYGLASRNNQFWHQDSPGLAEEPELNDSFGRSLAVADFNDDDYDDLAIGVWGESVGSLPSAGAVHVLYGSDEGLTASGSQFWHQDSAGVPGIVENNDWFGYGLSGGDFDGDGYDDLAVGAPLETVGTTDAAGAVNVIYGAAAGLTGSGAQLWHQDIPGSADAAETQDEFGNQLWHQNSPDIIDIGESLDRLGIALTNGDFDGDGYDDVAAGIAGEQVGTSNDAGAVQVIYGSENGLAADGNQWWQQNNMDLPGGAQEADFFGRALVACDFDSDALADLAVGAMGETVNGAIGAGAVNILYGTSSGLSTTGSQAWHQDSPGIVDNAESNDQFGAAVGCLSAARFAAFLPMLERAP